MTLVERAEERPETKVMVAFVRRFDGDYQDAFQKIQQGVIGRPIVIRSLGCEKIDTSPFYKQYLKGSGGIFVDSIIHDIDLALFLFGEDCLPKSVSAVGTTAIYHEIAADGDADNAVGICEFWDGQIAFFYNSRTAAHGYDNATEIFGTAGKLSINMTPRRNRVEICDGDGFVKVEPTPGWYDRYQSAFVAEANTWVEAVLHDKPMPIPITSSMRSLTIAMALQDSLSTGRRIEFSKEGARLDPCSCGKQP
jgi:myo-inositol 2-dehydrogenase / D-chiro-inositol 1-dehydrogenase